MDLLTVAVVVSLLLAGGGLVYWPMSLKLVALKATIEKHKRAVGAASDLVEGEREIDAARDLDPADELGVLLNGPSGPETPSDGVS